MAGYPLIIDLQERLVLVVGGGAVGRRKTAGLLEAGAWVRLVSRSPVPSLACRERVSLHQRPFHPADLDGVALAFAATGHTEVDAAVLEAARARGIPANLATCPERGDFTVPAVVRRGELLFSVSTGGGSPALAAVLREGLAAAYGPEWGAVVRVMARLRRENLTEPAAAGYSNKIVAALIAGGLPDLLAAGRLPEIDRLLGRVCGADITLSGLGLTPLDLTP